MRPKTVPINEIVKSMVDRMTPEDRQKYERVKRHKSQLYGYHSGDDSPFSQYSGYTVSDARSHMNRILASLKAKYQNDEEREKESLAYDKAWQKRHAEKDIKDKEIEKKLKGLTPKQVAINKCVDIQYWLRSNRDMPRERRKVYQAEFDDLKAKYGIKSYDLRRQKEYDPQYE